MFISLFYIISTTIVGGNQERQFSVKIMVGSSLTVIVALGQLSLINPAYSDHG